MSLAIGVDIFGAPPFLASPPLLVADVLHVLVAVDAAADGVLHGHAPAPDGHGDGLTSDGRAVEAKREQGRREGCLGGDCGRVLDCMKMQNGIVVKTGV